MDINELRLERAKLFHDACDVKNKGRVPHFAAFVLWKVVDAGYRLSEVFGNTDRMEECVRLFVEKYKVDALIDVGLLNSQFSVFEHFGEGYYYYDDEASVVGVRPFALVPIEELLEYCEDPTKYLYTKALPNKWPDIGERTVADWQKAFDENQKYGAYFGKMFKALAEEYGIPPVSSSNIGFMMPFMETLFNSIRGIKCLSIDVRRNRDIIKEAVEIMDARNIDPGIKKLYESPAGHDMNCCFDLSMVMLVHTILSRKAFDDLYWPTLKKILDMCQDMKKNLRITLEGSGSHIFDHFGEYKSGTASLYLEQDDIFEIRAQYPHLCLIGGMPTTLLGGGTPEECVDYTKKLIDEINKDGGYIFSENKFVSYKNDCRSDNLRAVCEYLNSYCG